MITSLTNERVRRVRLLLRDPRERRAQDRVVLEGVRLVRDAVVRGFMPETVFIDPERVAPADLGLTEAEVLAVSPDVMRHMSDTEAPPGVLAVCPTPAPPLRRPLSAVLILDDLRDPGNVGTILRTAAAAGFDGVLLAPGCADAFSPKALRAGMGAQLRIAALEASWTRIHQMCAGLHVWLADMPSAEGESVAYDAADWRAPFALIIGSEAHGPGESARTLAHGRVSIPMADDTESLNAGAAAAVLAFEAARTRRAAPLIPPRPL
jgi:TrmH family RNA methyltransferase